MWTYTFAFQLIPVIIVRVYIFPALVSESCLRWALHPIGVIVMAFEDCVTVWCDKIPGVTLSVPAPNLESAFPREPWFSVLGSVCSSLLGSGKPAFLFSPVPSAPGRSISECLPPYTAVLTSLLHVGDGEAGRGRVGHC